MAEEQEQQEHEELWAWSWWSLKNEIDASGDNSYKRSKQRVHDEIFGARLSEIFLLGFDVR